MGQETFIGAYRTGATDFSWLDSSVWNYENWATCSMEPNNDQGNEYCTIINQSCDGKNDYWKDVDCSLQYPFLCQIRY